MELILSFPPHLLLILILIINFHIIQAQEEQFLKLKNEMEEKVKLLQTKFSDSYAKRCEANFLNCENKSYNLCNGTGKRECLNIFPSPEQCLPLGNFLSKDNGLRFPNFIETENLTDLQKQFVCVSADLHSTFSKISQQNNNRHSFSFVGSPSGGIRVQPSFLHRKTPNECETYDPRARPWYSSAVSGAKNIVLFIDISGTMKRISSRFIQAKNAAQAILVTMGQYDEVGVISFSKEANVLGNFTSLAIANKTNKQTLIKEVENLQADDSKTNYGEAFQAGFSLYKESRNNREMFCESDLIFLFITDGNPNEGEQTFKGLSEFLDKELKELDETTLTFIAFALGQSQNTNFSVAQQLACKYGGFVQKFQDNSTLISKVQNYYDFFRGSTIKSKPFWTDPYDDALGLGNIVTVSIPIFQHQDINGLNRLIGVAGIDVLMSQFTKFDFTEEQVNEMLQQQKTCYTRSGRQACQLQGLGKLVGSDFKCKPQNNCSFVTIPTCRYSDEIFMEAVDTNIDTDKCCSLSKIGLAMIILGVVVFIGVTIGVLCYHKRIKSSRKQFFKATQQAPESQKAYDPKSNSELITFGQDKYQRAKQDGIQIYDEEPIDF